MNEINLPHCGKACKIDDAGYTVELDIVDGKRVYRAVDPKTGERQQIQTVPGAVTDWVAARGVAMLCGLT